MKGFSSFPKLTLFLFCLSVALSCGNQGQNSAGALSTDLATLQSLLSGSNNNSTSTSSGGLEYAYQNNLDTFDLFGRFYHRKRVFPELREITDISVVKLIRSLEKVEQTSRDYNQFILDGKQGLIFFSLGLRGLGAYSGIETKNARTISVSPSGKIAIVREDGMVILCHSFDGSAIVKTSSCSSVTGPVINVSALEENGFLALTTSNQFLSIDLDSGEVAALPLPEFPPDPSFIYTNENIVSIIHTERQGVTSFENKGGKCYLEWNNWRACQRTADKPGLTCDFQKRAWQACKRQNPGNHTVRFRFVKHAQTTAIQVTMSDGQLSSPLTLDGLAAGMGGVLHAVSRDYERIVTIDDKLNLAWLGFHPQVPLPYWRIGDADTIVSYPAFGMVHTKNRKAISVFSELPFDQTEILRILPSELIPIFSAVDDLNPSTFPLGQNIFLHPDVKPILKEALGNVQLE